MHPALEIKQALIDAALAAIPGAYGIGDDAQGDGVLVCNGHPGTFLPDDIVSFGRLAWPETEGPVSTRRVRDLSVQVYATVSVFRGGGAEMEAVCEARCLELADFIGDYLRETDPKLGGRALWCFRTNYESDGATNPDLLAKGRVIEALVEFTARARISS